jgi:hypothetical protein
MFMFRQKKFSNISWKIISGIIKISKFNLYNFKMEKTISTERIQNLQDMAHKLRIHSIEMTDASQSGYEVK